MTDADVEPSVVLESEISATIASLEERFEAVRRGAIQRVRGRLGNLSPDQENAVDSLSRGIVERVLQAPITMLQDAVGADEGELVLKTVRSIFNLRT
jgi:glutamyl-tRNA reductase